MRILLLLSFIFFLSSCSSDELEKNYELDYDPNHEIFLITLTENGSQKVEIPGQILFYGHNGDFIIANQKSRDSIYESNENLVYQEMESKIFDTKFSNFWIVTLKNNSIYGPLNKNEYFKMRKALNIPEALKLDNSTQKFYRNGQREDVEYYHPDETVVDIKNLKGNNEKHNIKK
jgi:hypothetical protein